MQLLNKSAARARPGPTMNPKELHAFRFSIRAHVTLDCTFTAVEKEQAGTGVFSSLTVFANCFERVW